MIVEIPTWFVPLAKTDYRAELLQLVNEPLCAGALTLPPPYPAWYTMLEMVESPYFRNPLGCQASDTADALWRLQTGRAALTEGRSELRETAFLRKYGEDILAHLGEIVQWTHAVPFGGFDMIPPGKDKPPLRGPWLFDAEYLSGVGLTLAEGTGRPLLDCLWEEPVCLAGFLRMHRARANGVEHVERPPDLAELRRIQKESLARAARGEKQPWENE